MAAAAADRLVETEEDPELEAPVAAAPVLIDAEVVTTAAWIAEAFFEPHLKLWQKA